MGGRCVLVPAKQKRESATSRSVPAANPRPGVLGPAAQQHVVEEERSAVASSQKPTLKIPAVIV